MMLDKVSLPRIHVSSLYGWLQDLFGLEITDPGFINPELTSWGVGTSVQNKTIKLENQFWQN